MTALNELAIREQSVVALFPHRASLLLIILSIPIYSYHCVVYCVHGFVSEHSDMNNHLGIRCHYLTKSVKSGWIIIQ